MKSREITHLQIEELELYYLEHYYKCLKFCEKEIIEGLNSKNKIKKDWENIVKEEDRISRFESGAERVIKAIIHNKETSRPNSSPIGSDIMLENDQAIIHIDIKTVQTNNIGDHINGVVVGDNQNSYKGTIPVKNKPSRIYKQSNLPFVYINSKPCLTYFISVLWDPYKTEYETLNINIMCMPNGMLEPVYRDKVLRPGKNKGEIRFNWPANLNFELIEGKKRFKVIYLKDNSGFEDRLKIIENLYKEQ